MLNVNLHSEWWGNGINYGNDDATKEPRKDSKLQRCDDSSLFQT